MGRFKEHTAHYTKGTSATNLLGGGVLKEALQFIMEGGSVIRYHTRIGIKPDTDAHHSHGVAMICEILSGRDSSSEDACASANLLLAALTHDLGEQVASDVSAPAKRLLGIGKQLHDLEQEALRQHNLDFERLLTENEALILRLADCFDGMLYCCRELALGNRNVLLIWRRSCSYVEAIAADVVPLEIGLRASNMYEAIKEIYQEVINASGPNFDAFANFVSK